MLPWNPGLDFLSGFFLSCVQIKILHTFLISPILATFFTHRFMLHLITLIMSGEICRKIFNGVLYYRSTKCNRTRFLDMKHGNEYKNGVSSLLCVHFIDIFADIIWKCQPLESFATFAFWGIFISVIWFSCLRTVNKAQNNTYEFKSSHVSIVIKLPW
jgi:hypothetical protein